MLTQRRSRLLLLLLAAALLTAGLLFVFLQPATVDSFSESFDSSDGWTVGEGASASATVDDGAYRVRVTAPADIYIGTYDGRFGDGVYEVTATQTGGPLDNGYGMVLRADFEEQRFYLFEISGDGYVWLGFCEGACDNQGWQASDAVRSGLNAPNQLRVEADGPTLTFFVNDVSVGRIEDAAIDAGAIGVMVETLGQPGVEVAFDEFNVTPLAAR